MLTREEILGRKLRRKTVTVPGWGDFLIRSVSYETAQEMEDKYATIESIIASVINEDGTPMFSPEDRSALMRIDVGALRYLNDEIVAFNLLKKDAAVEQEKNSVPGLNGASSTA